MKTPTDIPWTTYLLAAWAVLTVLFITLSPSASAELSFGQRVIFWAVHVAAPLVLLQAAQLAVSLSASQLSDWVSVTVSGLLGALAFVPVAWALDGFFPEDDDVPETWISALTSEVISTVVPVMLVWVALNAPRLLRIADVKEEALAIEKEPAPAFWNKVPSGLGRDLISLSAELHYLRVRTTNGDTLVLYPFGKAVQELATLPGQQVHRSHWVALKHITDIKRRGDGATVYLSSGPPLPVSRRFRKDAVQAWEHSAVTGAEDAVTRA